MHEGKRWIQILMKKDKMGRKSEGEAEYEFLAQLLLWTEFINICFGPHILLFCFTAYDDFSPSLSSDCTLFKQLPRQLSRKTLGGNSFAEKLDSLMVLTFEHLESCQVADRLIEVSFKYFLNFLWVLIKVSFKIMFSGLHVNMIVSQFTFCFLCI